MSQVQTWVHSELKRSLELLAAPPGDQLHHLTSIGCKEAVDELALELDDVFPDSGPVAGLELNREQLDAVRDLEAKLDRMSGQEHEDLWTPEALRKRSEWAEIRQAAKRALAFLD